MASKSTAILNQALFEDHDQDQTAATADHSQMGFFTFPPNLSFQVPSSANFNQSLCRAISSSLLTAASSQTPFDSSFSSSNLSETLFSSGLGGHGHGQELLSLQRSTANLWPWGEVGGGESLSSGGKRNGGMSGNEYHLGVSAMKMKKMKGRRRVREPRFSFKTMSDVDVLDDGYKWRKYGQKVVKNTQHPRSYYRCTQDHCRVKKRVERLAEDPRMVITTYEGRHIHSPSHDSDDSEAQTHLNNFFW